MALKLPYHMAWFMLTKGERDLLNNIKANKHAAGQLGGPIDKLVNKLENVDDIGLTNNPPNKGLYVKDKNLLQKGGYSIDIVDSHSGKMEVATVSIFTNELQKPWLL